jgi:phosphate:Na+ symporter
MLASILGGIGLFLLGMSLMTDGLKALAGEALRKVLSRFTGGPVSALLSGAFLTALVQSSSATTLATIGFVSAGLLTFSQSVGVILGTNVGTTSTGWIVSTIGLKLNVAALALPLIGVGAVLRLVGRGRGAAAGLALAGFGLLFLGIDTLQAGMKSLSQGFDPSSFPRGGVGARALLVLVGALMTVVMQSSSAAVTTTLTALHAGTLELEQAAALVIGQNIGTTVTAGFAAVGASVSARRTALAHVLFNGVTGLVAFVFFPLFLRGVLAASGASDLAVQIAAFHTAFNVLGVTLFLPFSRAFAARIEALLPEKGPQLTRHLDPSVTHIADVAIETARRTTHEIALETLDLLASWLRDPSGRDPERLSRVDGALTAVRTFLEGIASESESAAAYEQHLAVLHALDHLVQLGTFAADERSLKAAGEEDMAPVRESCVEILQVAMAGLRGEGQRLAAPKLERSFAQIIAVQRQEILQGTAQGALQIEPALRRLEAIRWMDRIEHHTGRVVHYLAPR